MRWHIGMLMEGFGKIGLEFNSVDGWVIGVTGPEINGLLMFCDWAGIKEEGYWMRIGMARDRDNEFEIEVCWAEGKYWKKQNSSSLNLTCREIKILPDLDKHLNPLCIGLGPM